MNNYGGLLQNYALQQVLKGMGHEVETVDWMPEYGWLKEWLCKSEDIAAELALTKMWEKPRYQPLTSKEIAVCQKHESVS